MELLKSTFWCSSIILFMLLIFTHLYPSAARFPGNETNRMALLDIKLQISDPSGFLNPWNKSQHHCQWPGVGCDMRHGRVISLTLPGMTLSGTISSHLGNLSFMKAIQLGENLFHGGIPQQLGQLSRLRFVDLSHNALSGKIPVNLSRCLELRSVNLIRNNLTGNIPSQLGFLTKLESIGVGGNHLTGMIPASLGNLSSSLLHLSLSENNLEGFVPSELGLLNRLVFLALGVNKLRGEIPASLFNISSLTNLTAPDNFLSGNLPGELPHGLRAFEIAGNNFTGKIPISITNCTNLEILDFGDNDFEGKVPISLGKHGRLQILSLQGNSLGGNYLDFLEPLSNCTMLTIISLSDNNFSGKLSSTLGNLSSQLTTLNFVNNKISGSIPMELGNLVGLNLLELGDNSLTGVIPASLAKLSKLEMLYLRSSRLSGQIPSALCTNMTNLYILNLADNNLVGDLSHSLRECRGLQEMFISGNKLSGIITSQMFGSYISPTKLVLASNSFSGTLPPEVGKLINLQWLVVFDNKLSGHIPLTIGDCSVLVDLEMNKNHFSGSLPSSLASLKDIEYLDLSDNSLTGTIPSGLNKLVYLNYLNLSYNDLEGEVPTDGIFSNASNIILEGNGKLCGGISELGLPSCPMANKKTKGKNHLKIILIPLLSTLVISIIFFLYLFFHKKSHRFRKEMPSTPSENIFRVSYHELYRATVEFSPANLIGSGAFGVVYKGRLENHSLIQFVAVKVLDIRKRGASKSFQAECEALSNLRHRNILPLLTYCSSIDSKGDEFKALVYKYMENGSLDMWLHPDQPLLATRSPNLLQRLNIAIDVASALDYLHNHSHIAVAHCDLKPSNILLDNDLIAYVGDFGLARLLPPIQQGASSSTIAIKGSIGYAAPEYSMGLKVSTQGDVYSYGILLLEMFTGRKPTDNVFMEGLDLHNYVKMGLSDEVLKIVDPSLVSRELAVEYGNIVGEAGEFGPNIKECLVSVLKIGVRCSQRSNRDRMEMKQVTRDLHFIRDAFHRALTAPHTR